MVMGGGGGGDNFGKGRDKKGYLDYVRKAHLGGGRGKKGNLGYRVVVVKRHTG